MARRSDHLSRLGGGGGARQPDRDPDESKGSNYPGSSGSLAELLGLAQREIAFLPESDRAAVFGGTALALYPALEAAVRT